MILIMKHYYAKFVIYNANPVIIIQKIVQLVILIY